MEIIRSRYPSRNTIKQFWCHCISVMEVNPSAECSCAPLEWWNWRNGRLCNITKDQNLTIVLNSSFEQEHFKVLYFPFCDPTLVRLNSYTNEKFRWNRIFAREKRWCELNVPAYGMILWWDHHIQNYKKVEDLAVVYNRVQFESDVSIQA